MKGRVPLVALMFLMAWSAGVARFADAALTGTLSPATPSVTWTGGPYTGVTADPSACTSLTCDNFTLVVNVPPTYYAANPTYQVRVHVSWQLIAADVNDFDVYVYDAAGNLVNSGTQGNTSFEDVNLDQPASGTYQVQVVAFATVNASYSGKASIGPPPPDVVRQGKYKTGKFTFSAAKALLGPDGLVFGTQDLEPRAAYDALGNIYVAAIEGTPGGTDVWASRDGGATFTYLGQPDGAQAASAAVGRSPGIGGGDEDIALGTSGRLYVTSLFGIEDPMSITSCSSTNGGGSWLVNPESEDIPLDDRQWIATYGDNTVYLTFAQLGADLAGTTSILMLKSTDGGLTFPQVTQVTTPELGVQPDFQGNVAVNPKNGTVYTVFIAHPGNSVYIARSTDGGKTFILKQVHQAAEGVTFDNVFPILALDRAGNPHVVYSDGTNIYLSSSADQGATWTVPVRINNGVETKTGLSPWVDAGDAGTVDIIWWATSARNNMASDAKWKVYFAQVQNAFANTPTITEQAATGVFHTGPICVHGTGCADGTRTLAEYASTTIYKDGQAMIVYPDDQQTTNPLTYFIKQTGSTAAMATRTSSSIAAPSAETASASPSRVSWSAPNPISTTATLRYTVRKPGRVTIKMYSVAGREVATLVDAQQEAGLQSVTFSPARLRSGVYYYKIQTPGAADVQRVVIVK